MPIRKKATGLMPVEQAPAFLMKPLAPLEVLAQVEKDVTKVPTDALVPLYNAAKKVEKQIGKLKSIIKDEIIDHRFETGAKFGDHNEHRRFEAGEEQIKVQVSTPLKFNEEKAHSLIEEKKIGDDVYTINIVSGSQKLLHFLNKHRAEVKKLGIVYEEVIDHDALAACVDLHKITKEEFAALFDKGKTVYTFKE